MTILFMCVANSARSQLAEGLAKQIFPNANIQSAGSHPKKVNPYAITVLKEINIDISQHTSKSVDDLSPSFIVNIDYIVTLCAEEVCPTMITQKAKKLHWAFPDPATDNPLSEEEFLKRFRDTRDAMQRRLEQFKVELGI